MSGQSSPSPESKWECQPEAWLFLRETLDQFCRQSQVLAAWRRRLLNETGTRLIDWLDHMTLGMEAASDDRLSSLGFYADESSSQETIWRHQQGLFPAIRRPSAEAGVAIKVESVEEFCTAHALDGTAVGGAGANFRMATVDATPGATFWIVERHGNRGFCPLEPNRVQREMIGVARDHFRDRPRSEPASGFAQARELFDRVAEPLGRDWACDLFFAAEREYWQSRNQAARVQKKRQDALGLGWANHDHHTYRCSREHFAKLVAILEHFGFVCRERFFAGAQAGWGAQVMEQLECGLVIFADVDLSPHEVAGDFAHQGLAVRDQLGTVGLWCKLHGESFLSAGMHHLECQFDFDAARQQLDVLGIKTMDPFTDFAFLRQAFTLGEQWSVDVTKLKQLVQQKWITPEEAEQFAVQGALGSHLEILERNDGYKGFNQSGVSDIIHRTDPRLQVSS